MAGTADTAHWGIEDPAAVEGKNIEKERAFAQDICATGSRLYNKTTGLIKASAATASKIGKERVEWGARNGTPLAPGLL
jgi:arsenate reductase (thioredoxin)